MFAFLVAQTIILADILSQSRTETLMKSGVGELIGIGESPPAFKPRCCCARNKIR
jgi:hypothetical protein